MQKSESELEDILEIKKKLKDFEFKLLNAEAWFLKNIINSLEDNKETLKNIYMNTEKIVNLLKKEEQRKKEEEMLSEMKKPTEKIDKSILDKL